MEGGLAPAVDTVYTVPGIVPDDGLLAVQRADGAVNTPEVDVPIDHCRCIGDKTADFGLPLLLTGGRIHRVDGLTTPDVDGGINNRWRGPYLPAGLERPPFGNGRRWTELVRRVARVGDIVLEHRRTADAFANSDGSCRGGHPVPGIGNSKSARLLSFGDTHSESAYTLLSALPT